MQPMRFSGHFLIHATPKQQKELLAVAGKYLGPVTESPEEHHYYFDVRDHVAQKGHAHSYYGNALEISSPLRDADKPLLDKLNELGIDRFVYSPREGALNNINVQDGIWQSL